MVKKTRPDGILARLKPGGEMVLLTDKPLPPAEIKVLRKPRGRPPKETPPSPGCDTCRYTLETCPVKPALRRAGRWRGWKCPYFRENEKEEEGEFF